MPVNTEIGPANFGEKRARGANVSYLEIERVATDLLLAGDTPSAAKVRRALGDRGSQQTLLDGLHRFRRDLGLKISGDPAALSRLPMEIAEAVETLWQRALALAAQSAKTDENEARAHLERLRIANEVHEHSLTLREKDMEAQTRERERTLADTRDQLLGTLRALSKAQEELRMNARRMGALEAQLKDYRTQLAAMALSVQTGHRSTKPTAKPELRRVKSKKSPPRIKSARRGGKVVRRPRRRQR
jgi:hypothetical protein